MRTLSLLVVFAVTVAGQGRALALGPGLGTHEHWSSEPTPQLGDGSRLEVSPHHRLYSATRGRWVAAGELGQEALRTQDGTTLVTRSGRLSRPAEVFNLEVFGTERDLVGQSRTLAHNSYAARGAPKALPAPRTRGNPNPIGERGTFYVDSKGNVIPTPPGGRITGSPDGRFIQLAMPLATPRAYE